MAISKEADVADTLLSHLYTLPACLASKGIHETIELALPGLSFEAPDAPYLRIAFLPNDTVNLFLGNSAKAQFMGILQVTVMYPLEERGQIPALEIAGAVVDHYAKGLLLSGDAVNVRIYERASIAPPLETQDRIEVPVSVRYQAFA